MTTLEVLLLAMMAMQSITFALMTIRIHRRLQADAAAPNAGLNAWAEELTP